MASEGGDSVNANARRQAIWHTLCARGLVTLPYLAARYRVSINTIKDDISFLSLSYPIVTIRGRNGGVKLADWYIPRSQLLSPAQLDFLFRLSQSLQGEDARVMEEIITRLTGVIQTWT